MDPEEQIPQDSEQQGDTSSNTYPGQWSSDKAQKLYNLSQTPKKIRNLKKGVKNAGKIAKGAVKTARSTIQAARAAYAAAQATYAIVSTIASLVSLKVIAIILIIFIIIVMFKIFIGDNSSSSSNAQLTSSGPIWAKIGDKLDYTISLNYPGNAKNIIITDKIPAGTEYVNAPQATYDPATNTVTWNIPATTSTTLSLTLLATKDNDYIINILKGTILGGVLGESDSLVTPTLFRTNPKETLVEKNSQLLVPRSLDEVGSGPNSTPTVFQLAPTNIPVSPQDTNVIKSCVVTKIGEPTIIPSLPPECASF